MDLNETTVLMTGATNGLGRAAAARLSQLGTTLLLHGRDRQREGARERLRRLNGELIAEL
jgi:NAD(P)-dependent dehydrogenase (short-subunit alcohol dehydrogenase family)